MMQALAALHFLRPHWLWALLLLPVLLVLWRLRNKRQNIWRDIVDPALLPHLLKGDRRATGWGALGLGLTVLLAVLALAGPSWRQQAQPLWQTHAPLVIALDLSSRISAPDLPPSRLLQARAKLASLLQQRKSGETALLVYADDAFTVAPLTDDSGNIALFLDQLSADIMPVDGQRPDRAIAHAAKLLQQANFHQGDILLLTDQGSDLALAAASQAASQGFRVSVLGVGTSAGAAYRNAEGGIAQAQLRPASLRAMASSGQGRYAMLATDDGDLRDLGVLEARDTAAVQGQVEGKRWLDQGYWLLPPLMLLALLAFRKGAGALALLACLTLPLSPAHAAGVDWWQRVDQQQHKKIEQGAEAYRQGDFKAAEQSFQGINTADAQYNLGNALAKQARYDEAIAAYDRALKAQPGLADARANRAAVDAVRKRPPSKQQGSSGNQGQQGGSAPPQNNAGEPSKPASSSSAQPSSPVSPSPPPASAQGRASRQAQPPSAADSATQKKADEAQKARMQQALAQSTKPPASTADAHAVANETAAQREQRQAVEAWLRRVPDEPGGLLKAKFRLEQERRMREGQ